MAHEWFVQKNGKQDGPLSAAQLKQLAASGQVTPTDLVRRADMTDWKKAASVKGLFPTQPQSEPTPPPTPAPPVKDHAPTPPHQQVAPSESADSASTGQLFVEKSKGAWSSFLGTAKAAKDLAAAQARKAKLTKFDLPAAYLALGKSVFDTGKFKEEFAELYGNIEAAKAEIEKLGQEQPASSEGQGSELKDKVRAGAASVKAKAQQKAVSVKVDSLYRELGRKAFESHGESAGPKQLVDSIIDYHNATSEIDAEIAGLAKTPFAQNAVLIGILVIFCFPVGLFFVWRHPSWSRKAKLGWSGVAAVVVVGILIEAMTGPSLSPDFYPFEVGSKRQMISSVDQLNLQSRKEISHDDDGVIQIRTINHFMTRGNVDLPLPPPKTQKYRRSGGFIEISQEVGISQKQTVWLPVIKLGAHVGDLWEYNDSGMKIVYLVRAFEDREIHESLARSGKVRCAIVEETWYIDGKPNLRTVTEYGKGLGPVRIVASTHTESGVWEQMRRERLVPTLKD